MSQHKWVKSTLGHGDAMCEYCKMTNREAAAIGCLNHCNSAPAEKFGMSERLDQIVAAARKGLLNDNEREALEAFLIWFGYSTAQLEQIATAMQKVADQLEVNNKLMERALVATGR